MLNLTTTGRTLALTIDTPHLDTVTVTFNGQTVVLDAQPTQPGPRPRPDHIALGNVARLWRTSCPEPHYCVLEYLARFKPEMLAYMDENPEATLRDGFKLTHEYKRKFKMAPPKVAAPKSCKTRA